MKSIAYVAAAAALLALSACKESEPVQTVAWYKEHDSERAAMIAKCRGNPGEVAASPNCINSAQAQNEAQLARRGHLDLNAAEFGKALKEAK